MRQKILKHYCKECGHRIWYDAVETRWLHKHLLHNDNCKCRKPTMRHHNNSTSETCELCDSL